ncbi:MAG: toxin-antitoxin system TumE family protein [Anaerolineae bacterium]
MEIEDLAIILVSESEGRIRGRVTFYDGSFLEFGETVEVRGGARRRMDVRKIWYKYHYQRGENLIFRYDNSPHHTDLPTFPHHKHIGDRIEPAAPPDLSDVLREIDAILYPSS